MKQLDVICVGNALIDAFFTLQNAKAFCRIDKKTQELCVKYGQKIHVDSSVFLPGGNACNVVVGLSRFGYHSSLCAEIGSDEFSQKILADLTKERIDTSLLIKKEGASSFAIGISFSNERTLFVQHVERAHNFSFENVAAKWLYVTSLGEKWEHAYKAVISFAKKNNIPIAFSPGTHQLEAGYTAYKEMLEHAAMLFVNKEEAGKIVNRKTKSEKQENIQQLLIGLQKKGPKVVSITDGDNGSYAIDGQKNMYQLGTFPCKVVEKTGAGDAYASGFLGAYIKGIAVLEAMSYGAVNAASVIEKVGAQTGLLHRTQIEDRLSQQKDFIAKRLD